jgi:hypothetical protein
MNDEPPDVYMGWDEGKPMRPPNKKEIALDIYKQLINDDELLYELSVLLRKNKIIKLENNLKND